MTRRLLTSAALAALLAVAAGAAPPALERRADVDEVVAVDGVRADGAAVEATIRNRGARELRDVRLLIEWVYHWPDEYHPGDESPGRAWTEVVPGPLAPGASERVRSAPPGGLPSGPGTFEPRVRVLGFTERGA